ncbi:hypothetical protein CR205_03605 [Alteribacter lacisalsi]|uniref:DUF3298 domain-containing protein n=1 Tax=Alteribacter lacisalsi TaxID=2045244 RepID=A0A2W0H9V1_9BACI|nr:WG repeat-containing protein [Alteribacter lacisalsi]PYZ97691.1 hypothetical protein CR205_03605 [Alteribacter lacisalsi]
MFKRIFVPRLFPASLKTADGTKWGYINETGQFMIPPELEAAGAFQENGLAVVTFGGAGIMNETGRFIVPPEYEVISSFSEELAVMIKNSLYGLLNQAGNEMLAPSYFWISDYKERRAVYQEADDPIRYGYLDESGTPVIPAHYLYAYDFSDGKALVQKDGESYALIDKNGTVLQQFPYSQMSGLSEGLIAFRESFQAKAGYVNENGEVVIEPQFSIALPFEGNRAVVNISEKIENRYGLINRDGAYVIEPIYNDIIQLGSGRAAVGKALRPEEPFAGSVYAVADSLTGVLFTDFVYDSVTPYDRGYSSVTQGSISFFINRDGVPAPNLPVVSGSGTLSFEGNLIRAFTDLRLSYFDRNGRMVWAQNTVIPLSGTVYIQEMKYRPDPNYLVYYPQFRGIPDSTGEQRVNRKLRRLSNVRPVTTEETADTTYTGDFSVLFTQEDLTVLELNGYEYRFGAAHGMPTRATVSVDIRSGRFFSLGDLFKDDADYVAVLSGIVSGTIDENPENYFPDAYEGISPDQPFYVTGDSLVLYFAPYEIAAFAAGFPEFRIPFTEIEELLDTSGAFWCSFHAC